MAWKRPRVRIPLAPPPKVLVKQGLGTLAGVRGQHLWGTPPPSACYCTNQKRVGRQVTSHRSDVTQLDRLAEISALRDRLRDELVTLDTLIGSLEHGAARGPVSSGVRGYLRPVIRPKQYLLGTAQSSTSAVDRPSRRDLSVAAVRGTVQQAVKAALPPSWQGDMRAEALVALEQSQDEGPDGSPCGSSAEAGLQRHWRGSGRLACAAAAAQPDRTPGLSDGDGDGPQGTHSGIWPRRVLPPPRTLSSLDPLGTMGRT